MSRAEEAAYRLAPLIERENKARGEWLAALIVGAPSPVRASAWMRLLDARGACWAAMMDANRRVAEGEP